VSTPFEQPPEVPFVLAEATFPIDPVLLVPE
jgi:hypothetical protein